MAVKTLDWRLAIALWLLGLPGVVAATLLVVPRLLPPGPVPAPLHLITAAAAAQSAILLGLAALSGAAVAWRVGLRCPLIEELLQRSAPLSMRPPLVAGALGGILGASVFLLRPHVEPPILAAAQERPALPIVVRVLYGGITEEILVRWGLMSAALWVLRRLFQADGGAPGAGLVVLAIVSSSLLFGAGHLPAAAALLGQLDPDVMIFLVLANALFGLLAGFLFWRFGLESAIVAHILAHVGSFMLER